MNGGFGRGVRVLAVVLVLVSLISGCDKSGGATVTMRETQTGQTVELKRGDKLIIELEGNPTTGFSWEAASVDADVLKQQGEPEFKAEAAKMGGGGTYTFTFAAARGGRTELKMVYHQSWDKETPPAKTFELVVVVQ